MCLAAMPGFFIPCGHPGQDIATLLPATAVPTVLHETQTGVSGVEQTLTNPSTQPPLPRLQLLLYGTDF